MESIRRQCDSTMELLKKKNTFNRNLLNGVTWTKGI